jgi:hypothetical protein
MGTNSMAQTIPAAASPEKRLFISLITRDLSLAAAFLDIIDNSVNAALEPLASHLNTADDYQKILANPRLKPSVTIDITIGTAKIVVKDTAPGISAEVAEKHVFKFGRAETGENKKDRLSVYGIGLKRAMFKCGNKIAIQSDHAKGGFDLKLDVKEWQELRTEPWTFDITPRPPARNNSGTQITITDLYPDVIHRLSDGLFLNQLRELIAKTYSFFIDRIVVINVNNLKIDSELFEIGENYSSHKLKSNGVSCNITAGIAVVKGDTFRDRSAGWYVFCNGRTVFSADKSVLTGWGSGLPIYQPKHRAFLGTVFFVASDPEDLPWTTTKSSINEESAIWQEARRYMVSVGRIITGFLDRRYTEDGTEVASSALQSAAGTPVKMLTAAVAQQRTFNPPRASSAKTTRIQYSADVADIKKIESYLRRPGMGGSEVGRYTFQHYLKNEVGG